jgi:spore coat protein YsxE
MEDTNNLKKKISPILKYYNLEPYFIESMGNILKVYSNKGVFALKKMNPQHGIDFIRHIQSLYQKGYNRIVPIYPTLDGRYAVLHDQNLYYLMPWMSNEKNNKNIEQYQQIFRELARLHSLSVREIPVSKEERKEHYEKTLIELEQEEEFLNGCLEACESSVYMSPFELMFCSYYHDINQALTYSKKRLKEWFEATEDHEKERIVITHGKISNEHFLYDDKGYGYFINFEQANTSSPLHDILPFLAKSLRGFPKRPEELVEWIYTYFKYFPLKEYEMNLFLSYLAHPGPVTKTAEHLFKEGKGRNEHKAVQKLQKDYWLLKNTEFIVSRIDETERQIKLQKEAQNEQ